MEQGQEDDNSLIGKAEDLAKAAGLLLFLPVFPVPPFCQGVASLTTIALAKVVSGD